MGDHSEHFSYAYGHNEWRDESPGPDPVRAWLVACHLLYACAERGSTEDPADGDRLEEAAPQDGDAAGAVEVHQLKTEG